MSPDPFRALDPVDPPDQWDEITRRAHAHDVDLDLDAVRLPRPRRRAAALVAAAAVIALVGGVIATTTDDEGAVTTDGPTSELSGPCPFTLDPETVLPELVPEEGEPTSPVHLRMRSSSSAPTRTAGSWATLDYGGLPVTVSVFADAATPPVPDGQTWELADDPGSIDLYRWRSVEGGPCRTAEVRVRLPLTEEDRAARAAEGDGAVDVSAYATPVADRVLAAVRLTDPGDPPPSPCEGLVERRTAPVTVPDEPDPPLSFVGVLSDGREFTVEATTDGADDVLMIEVDGDEGGGGGTRPDGPGDSGWSWTGGDVGIAYGWRPPDAVATAALRPDGSLVTEGLVISPGGTLYALPDVGRSPGPAGEDETWPIIHCRADGEIIDLEQLAQEQYEQDALDELRQQVEGEGERLEEQPRLCADDPEACPEGASVTTTLATGEEVVVAATAERGFCVSVDGREATCEAEGGEGESLLHLDRPTLWFGALPAGATADAGIVPVLVAADGSVLETPGVAVSGRLWILPLPLPFSTPDSRTQVSFQWPDGRIEPAA